MIDRTRLMAQLRDLVRRELPELGPEPAVRPLPVRQRPRSTFHPYLVGPPEQAVRLLVKVPRDGPARPALAGGRAPGFERTDASLRAAFEFEALRLVEQAMESAADARVRSIRPLGLILDGRALVMVSDGGVPLSHLLVGHSRWALRPRRGITERAFANAGAWLHRYHSLDVGQPPGPTGMTLDGYLAQADDLAGHLAARDGVGPKLARLVPALKARAREVLPDELPLGLRHGDFAMRNILVAQDGAVAVIDMIPRWRGPVYEDLAEMIVALRTNRPQTYSLGLAFGKHVLDRFERALFDGYGATSDVVAGARVFAVSELLDKWLVRAEALGPGRGWTPARSIFDRHFLSLATRLVDPSGGSPAGTRTGRSTVA